MFQPPFLSFRNLFVFFLSVTAVSLPLSSFFTSVGIISAFCAWFFEGHFAEKIRQVRSSPALWIFLLLYIVHVIGLINTTNFSYAFRDLKIKLPLLILPVILASSVPFTKRELTFFLYLFIAGTFISSLVSTMMLIVPGLIHGEDVRGISVFISHIRLSLMVNMAMFTSFHFVLTHHSRYLKILFFLAGLWFIIFLFLLKSITGLSILIIGGLLMVLLYYRRIRNITLRRVTIKLCSIVLATSILYIGYSVKRFYTVDKVNPLLAPSYTLNGRPYVQNFQSRDVENGHFIWQNLCEEELRTSWNARSILPYDGKDRKGQVLRFTLIRYLTSHGWPKDSVGVSRLSDGEVTQVENGVANYLYGHRFDLYPYIYRVIWEIDNYNRGYNPSGHSVTQRWVYWETALSIIRDHFWFGVGTGDVQDAFNQAYDQSHSSLTGPFRRRAHNQYITFWLTFGLPGFLLIMTGMLFPLFWLRKKPDFLVIVFLLISFLSMLTEDTLETQAGASFFALFYAVLIFGNERFRQPLAGTGSLSTAEQAKDHSESTGK